MNYLYFPEFYGFIFATVQPDTKFAVCLYDPWLIRVTLLIENEVLKSKLVYNRQRLPLPWCLLCIDKVQRV